MDSIIFSTNLMQSAEQPTVIKEVISSTETVRYIGFAKRGALSLNHSVFAIVKVTQDMVTNITTYQYSNGSMDRNCAFNGCENLSYSFLK